MDEARIRQLSSRSVYRNPWMELREDEVEFPNGSTGLYSVVDKRDFVVVLAHQDGGFRRGHHPDHARPAVHRPARG